MLCSSNCIFGLYADYITENELDVGDPLIDDEEGFPGEQLRLTGRNCTLMQLTGSNGIRKTMSCHSTLSLRTSSLL